MLSNHFYIGEVKYENEILPREQPPIMDRALFDAVRKKSLAQWSHRTIVRNKSDHLLTGLLFDDAGYRMGACRARLWRFRVSSATMAQASSNCFVVGPATGSFDRPGWAGHSA